MPGTKDLIKDFYAKYEPEKYSEEQVAKVEEYYQGDNARLIKDFYAKYEPDKYSEDQVTSVMGYYFPEESGKKKDQTEVQPDMESVSEDGSSVIFDIPQTGVDSQQQEVSLDKEALSEFYTEESKRLYDDASVKTKEVLGDDFDYLSTTTEAVSEMLPAAVDDRSAEQVIEERKKDALNKLGQEDLEKRLKLDESHFLAQGYSFDQARRLAERRNADIRLSEAINTLKLDDEELSKYREDIFNLKRLKDIPVDQLTPQEETEIIKLSDSVSALREDPDKQFINPLTGKIDEVERKAVMDLSKQYAEEAKTDFSKFSERYNKEYNNIRSIKSYLYDTYGENYNFGDSENIPAELIESFKWDYENTKPGIASALGLVSDEEEARFNKTDSLLKEYEKASTNFKALNRALLLNEDPSAVSKGFEALEGTWLEEPGKFITSFGEGFAEAIPGVDNVSTDRDFRKEIVKIANEEGVKLTEDQYDSAVDDLSERLGETFGVSAEIMAEIVVTTALTKNVSSAVGLASKIGRLVNTLGGGQKTAKLAGGLTEALEQAIAFDLTSEGTAAMGLGEFYGAKGADKVLNLLTKGKTGKLMKFFKPLTRTLGATTAGTVEEYAGEYLDQGFKNGFLSEETFRNTFGRDYDEAKDKLLMTLVLSGAFGTGVEVSNMYRLGKDYYASTGDQTRLNDVEKAYQDIQEAKQQRVVDKFDNMSEAEIEQYAKDNEVDLSQLKQTIDDSKEGKSVSGEIQEGQEPGDIQIDETSEEEAPTSGILQEQEGEVLVTEPEVAPEGDTFTQETPIEESVDTEADMKVEPEAVPVGEKITPDDRDVQIDEELNRIVKDAESIEKPKTAREVRKIQKRFKDFVSTNKKILKEASPALNATISNKIANISSPATLNSTSEYITKVIKDTKFRKKEEARVAKADKLLKEIDPKVFRKKSSKPAAGKFDVTYQGVLKEADKAVNMTREEAADQREQILSKYEDLTEISDADLDKLDGLMFADLQNQSDVELDNLTQLVKTIKKEGRELQKKKKAERQEKYKKGQEDVIKAVTKGEDVQSANQIRSTTKTTKGKVRDAAKLKGVSDSLKFGVSLNENWSGLMNQINRLSAKDVGGAKKAQGFLTERFVTPVNEAESNKMKAMRSTLKDVRSKKEEIFGDKTAKTNKYLQERIEITDSKGNNLVDKNGNVGSISRDEAMYIYNLTKDPSLNDTFEKMYKNDFESAKITEALDLVNKDPKLKEYADWVHDEYYPNFYQKVNAEYRKQYDLDLPFNPDYSPVFRDGVEEVEMDVLNPSFNIASTLNGSLKERKSNTKPLNLSKGLEGTMLRYADQMEHFINYTDLVKDLNRVFGDQKVKNAISQEFSPKTNQIIKNFIEDFANKPSQNALGFEWLQNLRKNYTTSVLGLNPTVFLKQLTSAPAYAAAEGVNPGTYMKEVVKTFGTKKGWQDLQFLKNSDFIQNRMEMAGFDRDTALSFEKDFDDLMSGTTNLKNRLMFMTKYGDVGAILIGGTPYYRAMKSKYMKQGMSESKASEKALRDFEDVTKSTQQSANVSELSQLQRGNEIQKLFTMFKTSPAQYFRKTSSAYRNIARGRFTADDLKKIAMFQFVLPSLFTLASKGFTWDEDDLSDYEDSLALGNLQGIPLVGDLVKYFLDQKAGKPFDFNTMPALSGVAKAIKGIATAITKGDMDIEDFMDDILFPTLEGGTGLPLKNTKKLTLDNFRRIDKDGVNSWADLMKAIGYSEYALDRDSFKPKKKTKRSKSPRDRRSRER